MQEGAASEPSPRDAHVVQGLGSGPLLQGLLANLEEDSTTALTLLGAHDMHAPLVLDAGAIGAGTAEEISVEVGQVVVVALDTLDQLAVKEPPATASTDAALGVGDGGGLLMLADLAGERRIRACANPYPEVDQVDAGAGAAGHRPDRAPYMLDFVSALAVEGEASGLAGGWVRGLRGRLIHVNTSSVLAAVPRCSNTCGAIYVV
jgi:hypothetical protein